MYACISRDVERQRAQIHPIIVLDFIAMVVHLLLASLALIGGSWLNAVQSSAWHATRPSQRLRKGEGGVFEKGLSGHAHPDVFTFSVAIGDVCEKGASGHAHPDVFTYSVAIGDACEKGTSGHAGPDVFTYSIAIGCACEKGTSGDVFYYEGRRLHEYPHAIDLKTKLEKMIFGQRLRLRRVRAKALCTLALLLWLACTVGFLQQMGHLWEELRHGLAALRQRLWSCLPYGAASASPLELLSCATILQSSDAPQERRLLAMVILMLADMQLHAPSLIACRVASLVGAIALQGSWYILLLVVIFPTFPPVRKRPAGASEETAERAEEAGVDRLARMKQRCGYCGLCQSVIRDLTGHCSRRPQCKHNPGTRKLTEAEMAALVSEFHEEQKDPEVAKRKRVEQAKAKHEQEWKPPSGSPVSHGPYCLQFGKHAKKTVSEVAAADPGYFPHLMASSKGKILTTWPGLKEALASEGLLDNLVQNLPDRMREGAERVLLRAEEQQYTHPKIHPEIQKLRRLQQIAASQTLDESQKGEALASLPAVGKEDVAEGSLRKKRRRTLRSTAMRLLPHCRVCGAIAHKEPTCPYKDEDQAGPRRRRGIQWFLNKKLAQVVSRSGAS
jgi:hypothetical protein